MFGKELDYVLTDCDGTISDHDFNISNFTKKAIKKYQKKSGYKFSFITGRLDISSKKIASELKVQLPVVSCNGGLITDINTGEILHAEYLNKNACVSIFKQAHELGLDIMVYEPGFMVGTPNSIRLNKWKEYNSKIEKKYQFNTKTYNNLFEIANAIEKDEIKPIELIFYAENEKIKNQGYEIFEQFSDVVDCVQSLPVMFNVMNKGVNKLFGLKKWSEIIGINYKEVVTFGDNYNDIEMIEGVNKGYAVGNAVDELKQVAFKVIDPIEKDGVGKQLLEIIEEH